MAGLDENIIKFELDPKIKEDINDRLTQSPCYGEIFMGVRSQANEKRITAFLEGKGYRVEVIGDRRDCSIIYEMMKEAA